MAMVMAIMIIEITKSMAMSMSTAIIMIIKMTIPMAMKKSKAIEIKMIIK